MAFTHVFASIPVSDLDAAIDWYERFAGTPPDLIPNANEAAWRLHEAAWICVVADAPRAGSAFHTLLIEDLDALLTGLSERGIDPGEVETLRGNVRRTIVTDPDGNRLNVGQVALEAGEDARP